MPTPTPEARALRALSLLTLCSMLVMACGGSQKGASGQADESDQTYLVMKSDVQPGERPWGDPVSNPAADAAVMKMLAGLAGGEADADRYLAAPFMIGPGLWSQVSAFNARLTQLGNESMAVFELDEVQFELPMRTFADRDAVRAVAGDMTFRAALETFRDGRARAATEAERELLFRIVPIDLEGKPVTIIEKGDDRLLAYGSERELFWLDIISAYEKAAAR